MALIAGEARLSYRQLDERSNRLAHHLAASGNRPGDWIGILAQNRAEWIESMLAAYKLRAAPINLNFRYADEELRYVLDDADLVKTAQTFPVIDGMRWVVPGDFATLEADGTLVPLGRGSVCINSGGEKIFPEEVEAALKSHSDVFDAVVVGIPDERFGERVAALVAPRPRRLPTLEQLASHCREKIAGYKVPRALVRVDEIVRTPAGKPDYRWAKARASQG